MKKHNRLFTIGVIGLVFVIAGIFLMGAGLSIGGSKTYLSINKETAPWWPFSGNLSINGWTNEEIVHISTKKSFIPKKVVEINVEGDIEIRKGSENTCTLYNIEEDRFEMKEEKDKLIIQILSPRKKNANQKLILELKEPEKVKVISASVETGDIDVSNLKFEEIYVKSNVGDVVLENVQAKEGNLSSDTGDIETVNTIFENVEISTEVGDVDFDGDIKGNSIMNNEVGDVYVSLMGTKEAYGFIINSSLGDIEIDDEAYSYGEVSLNTNAKQMLQITCDTGSVAVDFR